MSEYSIDESGYTGRDLLQKSQPWQGASAINITNDDAQYLIKQHFPKLQAPELKFSSLKRRVTNQKPLYLLQKDILENFKSVTCVADKRFLLIQMFIEYAVEPFYYANDINLYENGGNVTLASMAYHVCQGYYGRDFDNILLAFQNAMFEKTPTSIETLISSIHSINWNRLPEFFGPLALEHPDCIDAIVNPSISTDAAFVILQALISRTELMADEPYTIKHDRSDNLLQYNNYLSMLINCKSPAEFKMSEIAGIKYPLKVKQVNQVDSKLHPSVQLCDILIGSAIAGVRELIETKEISFYSPLKLYKGNQIIHFTPNIDFESEMKFRNGSQGNEMINFIARQFKSSGY
ncbi:DUF3800 domain-containing protein [Nissabacter archeti]|jgi:hypothetical protein|uniref:DUF3800 domain-containing protein n=1 Tax=Nissabacter archeti TaxID=1917880 RepID=UPI000933B787|nr:DUF3800 domain-containing protein [Nissabacter archeti]